LRVLGLAVKGCSAPAGALFLSDNLVTIVTTKIMIIRISKCNYQALKQKSKATGKPITRIANEILIAALQKKAKQTKDVSFEPCKRAWFEHWQQQTGSAYISFNGAQGSALKLIIAKIRKQFPDNKPEDVFSALLGKLPAFYKSKNLTLINSHYDSIIAEISAGKERLSHAEATKYYGF
jgi:hypothetical protein